MVCLSQRVKLYVCWMVMIYLKTKLREINKFFQSNKATNFVQINNFTKNIIKENRHFYFLIFYQIFFQ